ncbi:AMP-dependent synthetase/ligase [Amycolatopsis japonica]|uniref:AMP-dependent synthetase/ligase n=1 Tax=Amycolatopsis japonica TaxID=208439 RepID=UPI003672F221
MTERVSAASVSLARSMCALFQDSAAADPDRPALRTPGDAVTITWREYARRVAGIAAGLAALGVRKGDTVALMLSNRPEFHLVDTAAFHLGAIPFSVYNTSSAEQIGYVFANAANRVVVCEKQFLPRLREIEGYGAVQHVVCVDGAEDGVVSLADIEAAGDPGFDFEAAWQAVEPDDVLTLIYTSGTTGPPKGVELTHRNLLHSVAAGLELADAEGARVVSYLPDAHIANRWFSHYAPIVAGGTVTTVADPKTLIEALPDARPTLFLAVPALWYKIKAALDRAVAAEHGPRKALLNWALDVARRKVEHETEGRSAPMPLRVRHALADRLVLSPLRKRFGFDQVSIAVTGAAPIAVEALTFVLSLGIPVCEGWGMSEVSAFGTVNRPGAIRVGTVGTAAAGVEVELAGDGELLVRGPMVMKGYRGDPAGTAEAIDAEGWLHTGDIATIDDEGYVRIVDRKKELIINAAGKNMSPSNIENTVLVACPLIASVVAIGDNRKYVVALITLDPEAAARYAEEHSLTPVSAAALATDPGIHAIVEAGIAKANAKLSRVEQIKDFTVLPAFWEPGGAELTPTLKVKRKAIAEKYAAEIDALYPSREG